MSVLSPDEQDYLLRLARAAIRAELACADLPRVDDAPARLRFRAGAFVSLHNAEDLRGCVGYIDPAWLLPETVVHAGAAVTRDGRFEPLLATELPALTIEISVLSPPTPIEAKAVEVGRHGLILRCAGRSGLLLPQVPLEWGWDRAVFLEQLCRKAGLPPGAWQHAGAELLAFTAERFDDRRPV